MLGIVILFSIGSYFYKLAEKFNKNKWLYGILGVVVYFVGTTLTAGMIGIIMGLINVDVTDKLARAIGYATIPIGFLLTFVLYKILKPNWEEEYKRKQIIERNKSQALGVFGTNEEKKVKVEEKEVEENFRK